MDNRTKIQVCIGFGVLILFVGVIALSAWRKGKCEEKQQLAYDCNDEHTGKSHK